jgi:hypothetical protein
VRLTQSQFILGANHTVVSPRIFPFFDGPCFTFTCIKCCSYIATGTLTSSKLGAPTNHYRTVSGAYINVLWVLVYRHLFYAGEELRLQHLFQSTLRFQTVLFLHLTSIVRSVLRVLPRLPYVYESLHPVVGTLEKCRFKKGLKIGFSTLSRKRNSNNQNQNNQLRKVEKPVCLLHQSRIKWKIK